MGIYMAAFIFEIVHSDHLNGPWQGLSVRSNIVGISASQIRNLGERLPALPIIIRAILHNYYQSHPSQLLDNFLLVIHSFHPYSGFFELVIS